MSESYENEMVKAFVGKPNRPKKEQWYMNAFAKMDENNKANSTISWKWSWYSFFFGPFFLLYRKAYMAAFLWLLFLLVVVFVPIIVITSSLLNPIATELISRIFGLLCMILIGGFGTHFVYKAYLKKRKKIEEEFLDDHSRVEAMKKSGGYHKWAIWLVGFLFLLPLIVAVIAPRTSATRSDAQMAMVVITINTIKGDYNTNGKFQNWDTRDFTDIKGDPSEELSTANYNFRGDRCLLFTTTPKGKLTIAKGEDLSKTNCQELYDMLHDRGIIEKFPTIYNLSKKDY